MSKVSLRLIFTLYLIIALIKQGYSTGSTNTGGDQQPQSSAQRYPPFMVFLSEQYPSTEGREIFVLPSKYTNSDQNLSLAADELALQKAPLCPELRTKDDTLKSCLRSLNDSKPDTKGCLFVAEFQENEQQLCENEPEPWIAVDTDAFENELICGINNFQRLINSQYYNCGTKKELLAFYEQKADIENLNAEQSPLFVQAYIMYDICYDFKMKKTLWTRHNILTTELLTHKHYPHKDLDTVNLEKFNDDKFNLAVNYNTFSDIKNAYRSVDSNMKIYHLVPKDHMALPYYKKSTDHMINSAPLLPEFIPLMKAIHNGILLASNHYNRKFNQILKIYTAAETIYSLKHSLASTLHLKSAIKYMMPVTATDVFRPNMWYMIVHNEDAKSAILLVLHNTREVLPAKKECDQEIMLPCDFKYWAEDPNSITSEISKHAYCCPITQEKIRALFSISENNLQIHETLDIEEIISLEKNELSKSFDDE